MELKDCVREFVKARDAISRTLVEHSEQGDVLTFTHKHKVHHFLVSEELVVPKARDCFTVACLNTRRNLEFLVEHWEEFLQEKLSVLFVHPSSGAVWKVSPLLHASVSDPKNLRKGLESLFSQVPEVSDSA